MDMVILSKRTRGRTKKPRRWISSEQKQSDGSEEKERQENYKNVDSYKPSGNKVYSDIFLNFE